MARIETVNGPLAPDSLGWTLPHEHLFIDRTGVNFNVKSPDKCKFALDMIADLKFGAISEDNLRLESLEDAQNELAYFAKVGGRSVVDVTVSDIGRNVKALKELSTRTRMNIVCATGWYTETAHSPHVRRATTEELVEMLIKELTEDIQNTGTRAGIIGEIGCSEPLGESEKKTLTAAAQAQSKTGAPLTIHTPIFDKANKRTPLPAPAILEILRKNDAKLEKVYLSHMDYTWHDPAYQGKIMDEYGVTLSYDTFGSEQWNNNYYFGAGGLTDKERVEGLVGLIKNGYGKNLLVSQDICKKMHLRKFGGYGYSHVAAHILPMLTHKGVSESQIQALVIENPRRILSW